MTRPARTIARPVARPMARAVLAVVFIVAGVLHLLYPAPFLAITPGWVPWPEGLIRLTGVAELLGGAGLFIPRLRRAAGIGLALYAVCVYPANIKHALDAALDPAWYHWPRLALQPVIVWWALWAAKVIDWPFPRPR